MRTGCPTVRASQVTERVTNEEDIIDLLVKTITLVNT